jgi:hypothetical protein
MKCFRLNKNPGPEGRCYLMQVLALAMIFSSTTSCRSYYSHLQPGSGDVNCIRKFVPAFTNTLYSAYVDVTKHHFSGILFFKQMPDSSMRIVFTTEMGVKFFDFAFTKDGDFIKYYILPKLDKKVIIKALRNDMELILLHPDLSRAKMLEDTVHNYVAVPTKKGGNYYITDKRCEQLIQIEKASKRKPVVEVKMMNYKDGIPDTINIQHKNFKFNISLKDVEK